MAVPTTLIVVTEGTQVAEGMSQAPYRLLYPNPNLPSLVSTFGTSPPPVRFGVSFLPALLSMYICFFFSSFCRNLAQTCRVRGHDRYLRI